MRHLLRPICNISEMHYWKDSQEYIVIFPELVYFKLNKAMSVIETLSMDNPIYILLLQSKCIYDMTFHFFNINNCVVYAMNYSSLIFFIFVVESK